MGTSCSAILVLLGQINQLSVQTIRVVQSVDEFRQFGQDIDRQGLIWAKYTPQFKFSFLLSIYHWRIYSGLTLRAALFNSSPAGTLAMVGNMAWYSGWAVNSLFSKSILLNCFQLFIWFKHLRYVEFGCVSVDVLLDDGPGALNGSNIDGLEDVHCMILRWDSDSVWFI